MTPYKTTRNGQAYWTVDLRSAGKGRLFSKDKTALIEKVRKALSGLNTVEFTDQDRLAKHELGDRATLLDCVRYYLGQQVPGTRQKLSVAIAECVEDKKGLRPAYLSHLEMALKMFLKTMGDVDCSAVTIAHTRHFLTTNNWAHETKVGMRNRLSAFFTWCVDRGYCITNPTRKVALGRAEKVVPKILTVEETHRLLDTALVLDPVMVPYFALGIFCGIRPDELRRLPPECVRTAEAIVEIPANVSKTHDRRIVDISPNALAWLVACGKALREQRIRRKVVIRLARVKWSHDVMRHSFASYHLQFHGSADKTAMQMGHHGSTKTLYRHYKATVDQKSAEAFWKIEPVLMPVFDAKENVA
jgi:integrase